MIEEKEVRQIMRLADMKIREYLDTLKSNAPAPGGGTASAIAGAQGAALVLMVCELTIGKEKFQEYEELCSGVSSSMEEIFLQLIDCIDEDTEAFNKVAAAFKLPKDTDEEREARSEAIAEATVGATEVPFKIMKLGLEGIRLAQQMVGKSNPNASSDIGVGALNLKACVLGAWLNVKINLPGINDENLRKDFEGQGEKMVAEATEIADECYRKVLSEL